MRRRLIVAASLFACVALLATGCGASESPRDALGDSPPAAEAASASAAEQQATGPEGGGWAPMEGTGPVPEGWVSIDDCEAVEAILNSFGPTQEEEARAFLEQEQFGSGTKIKRDEDGFTFMGGGKAGTGACSFS